MFEASVRTLCSRENLIECVNKRKNAEFVELCWHSDKHRMIIQNSDADGLKVSKAAEPITHWTEYKPSARGNNVAYRSRSRSFMLPLKENI